MLLVSAVFLKQLPSVAAQTPRIHWLVVLLPFVVLVALQVPVIRVFGSDWKNVFSMSGKNRIFAG